MAKVIILTFTLFLALAFPTNTLAQRGCCSWHDGVSGCDSSVGRIVCNDGTYSPSCTCARSAPRQTVRPTPRPTVYSTPRTIVPLIVGETTPPDDTAGLLLLGGTGYLGLMFMGWIVNQFRRPNKTEARLVKAIIDAQIQIKEGWDSPSEYYLKYFHTRKSSIDYLAMHSLQMTSTEYEELVKTKRVQKLYEIEYKRYKYSKEKKKDTDTPWFMVPVSYLAGLMSYFDMKASENIINAIVFYPLMILLGLLMLIGVMFSPLILFVPVYGPFLFFEQIGWIGVITWWAICSVIYLAWDSRKKSK